MAEVLRLKPKESSFYQMARNITRRKLDAIFVCEGKRDSEVLKGIMGRIFEDKERNLAVTDCEGKDAVTEIAKDIAALASVSRTLRAVPIVIDADEHSFAERARSISDSLRAIAGIDLEMTKVDMDIFEPRSQSLRIKVFVKVVGDPNLPYKRHTIDDHIVRLLLLENLVEKEKIEKYDIAKECIDEFIGLKNTAVKELILSSQPENVQKAFENLVKYLKVVGLG